MITKPKHGVSYKEQQKCGNLEDYLKEDVKQKKRTGSRKNVKENL